jgi:hypothetical protein
MTPFHWCSSLHFSCCTSVRRHPRKNNIESDTLQGLMFWEAKKKKSADPSTIELFAVLTLSVLVLMIHLFLAGTYAALIVS